MSYETVLIAMVVGMTTVHAAAARQPEVNLFGAPKGDFLLIEPGFVRPASTTDVEGDQAGALSEPEHVLASFASEAPQTNRSSLFQNVSIPPWMRSSSGMSAASFVPLLPSPTFRLDCGRAKYSPHPALNPSQEMRRQRHFFQMAAAACGAGVPVELFDALIIQESRYNPYAVSAKGASGLTQLMPATAESLGIFDRWNVSRNLVSGARYLRKQLDTFGNWAHALGAYNAGPGNVTKYRGVPPFRETRGYVMAILTSIDQYQQSRREDGMVAVLPGRSVMLSSFNR